MDTRQPAPQVGRGVLPSGLHSMGRYQAQDFRKKQIFQHRGGAMLNPGDSVAKRAAAQAKQAYLEPYLDQPAVNSGAYVARPEYHAPDRTRIIPEQAPAAGRKSWYYQTAQAPPPRAPVQASGAYVPNIPPEYKTKVLRFEAFFWENVTDTAFEPVRIRKCLVYYFLEDDTLQIIEPRQDNSGIPQGVFLKRHRVMSDTRQFVTWADINLRAELVVYGRRFRVVNCDDFTKHFYKAMNRPLEPPEPYPEDPHEKQQKVERDRRMHPPGKPSPAVDPVKRYMEAQLGKPTHLLQRGSNQQQWLSNDRKVLRFFCQWDDRQRMYGERHQFILLFYLANDTVEVLEEQPRTSLGFVHYTPVLRRQRLPKDYRNGVATFGAAAFYQPQDLRVGDTVNVFGRPVLLYDCDDFTRQYYADSLGIIQGALPTPRSEKREAPAQNVPAYEGLMIGTEEDTMQNTRALQPRAVPRVDYWKFMHYDQTVLQFSARLDTNRPEDIDREFVIKFHLADDTMLIVENAPLNSGLIGGKFLQRSKVKDPRTNDYYNERDLYVGASIEVSRRVFFLTEADEFTLRFMESNSEFFLVAHVPAIHDKLQRLCRAREGLYDEIRRSLQQADPAGRGYMDMLDFQVTLGQLDLGLVDHEVITLMRHYDPNRTGTVAYEDFCAAIAGPSDYVPPEQRRAARDAALAAAQEGAVAARLGPAAPRPIPAPAEAWGEQPAPAPRREAPAAQRPPSPHRPAPAPAPAPALAVTGQSYQPPQQQPRAAPQQPARPPSPAAPAYAAPPVAPQYAPAPPPPAPVPPPQPVPAWGAGSSQPVYPPPAAAPPPRAPVPAAPYAYGPPAPAAPPPAAAPMHYPYATQPAQPQQPAQPPANRPPTPGRFGPEPALRSPARAPAGGPAPRYVSPRASSEGRPASPGPRGPAAYYPQAQPQQRPPSPYAQQPRPASPYAQQPPQYAPQQQPPPYAPPPPPQPLQSSAQLYAQQAAAAPAYEQPYPAPAYEQPYAGEQPWPEQPLPSETPRVPPPPPPVGATPEPAVVVAAANKNNPNRSIYSNPINPHPQVPEVPAGTAQPRQSKPDHPLYQTSSQRAYAAATAAQVAAANAAPRGREPFVAPTAQARLSLQQKAAVDLDVYRKIAQSNFSSQVLARKETMAAMQANRFRR